MMDEQRDTSGRTGAGGAGGGGGGETPPPPPQPKAPPERPAPPPPAAPAPPPPRPAAPAPPPPQQPSPQPPDFVPPPVAPRPDAPAPPGVVPTSLAAGRPPGPAAVRPGPPPAAGPQPLAGRQATRLAAGLAPGAKTWGWPEALLGVVVGFGPQLLLYLAALYGGALEADTTIDEVTLFNALVVIVSTAVLYGWQTVAAWLFSLRISRQGLAGWGFTWPSAAFFWTIPVALVASYAISAVHGALVDPPPQDIVEQFPRTVAGGALFVVIAVVFAPLFEEVFFRGFLYKGLRNSWGWWPAALGSAAVFGIAHLQLTVFVPIFALGVALAWVYERTGSLWTSIAMHAIFNGLAVLVWALGVA